MASSRASRASGASRPSRARASGSYEERREVLDDEQENDHEEEEANNAQQEEVRYALRQTPSRREHSRRHSSLPRSVGRRGSRRSRSSHSRSPLREQEPEQFPGSFPALPDSEDDLEPQLPHSEDEIEIPRNGASTHTNANETQYQFPILDALLADHIPVIQAYNRERANIATSQAADIQRMVKELRLRGDDTDYLSTVARRRKDRKAFIQARGVELWVEEMNIRGEMEGGDAGGTEDDENEEENEGEWESDEHSVHGNRDGSGRESGSEGPDGDNDLDIDNGSGRESESEEQDIDNGSGRGSQEEDFPPDQERRNSEDSNTPNLQSEIERRQAILQAVQSALVRDLAVWDGEMPPASGWQDSKRPIYVVAWLMIAALLLIGLIHLIGDMYENGPAHTLHITHCRLVQLWRWLALEETSRWCLKPLLRGREMLQGFLLRGLEILQRLPPFLMSSLQSGLSTIVEAPLPVPDPPKDIFLLSSKLTPDALASLKDLVVQIAPMTIYLRIAAQSIIHNGMVARESKLPDSERLARGYDDIYAGMESGRKEVNAIAEGVWYLVTFAHRDLDGLVYMVNEFQAQATSMPVPASKEVAVAWEHEVGLANLLVNGLNDFAAVLSLQIKGLRQKIDQANATFTNLDTTFGTTEYIRLQIENRVAVEAELEGEREKERERERELNKHTSSWSFPLFRWFGWPWGWGVGGGGNPDLSTGEWSLEEEQERRERIVQRTRERSLSQLKASGEKSQLWLTYTKEGLDGLMAALDATTQAVAYLKTLAGERAWEGVPKDSNAVWRMRAQVKRSLIHIQEMIESVGELVIEGQEKRKEKARVETGAFNKCLQNMDSDKKNEEPLWYSLDCLAQELGLRLDAREEV